jgi:hypothetical protein
MLAGVNGAANAADEVEKLLLGQGTKRRSLPAGRVNRSAVALG